MAAENVTTDGFLIVGFSDLPQLQVPLSIVLLLVYLMTLIGNLLVMIIVYSNPHLHTPMYFFISNLSFLDISYTSVISPPLLAHFLSPQTQISFTECLLQVYFVMVKVNLEFVLLAVMAYDRYVAICNPLRYMAIMNKAVCFLLAAGSWVVGLLNVIPHAVLLSRLSFCGSHTINHFFCDVTALMKLSCSSTLAIEAMSYMLGATVALMSFSLITTSYTRIISSIWKIHSREGRSKAFSTCASHLIVAILFYGSVCATYLRPTSTYSMNENKIFSLFYTGVTPLWNPIIYSLKNTEFIKAMKNFNKITKQ
ncbi:olfactory receptor 5V1-like [Ambystoma mexicanum]|uniref:olfactory receptor 5V1-like n=1 Tax=Ambystoma mexicanum TaxID=8296 RepID=UPI0037E85E77